MRFIYTFFLFITYNYLVMSQTVDGQFITVLNPPTYEVTIAANMQSGTGTAGVVSIEFTYNTTSLSFSSSPVKNTDFILQGDFDTYATQNITRPSANAVRISLFTLGTPAPVPLSTTPTNIITLNFTILNQAGSSNLVWITTRIAPQFPAGNYTIGNWVNLNETPLPVELSSFTGKVVEETKVELNWETKTEVNNYGFDIQRRTDTDDPENGWISLGFIEGNGNSNSPKKYNFRDTNPLGGSKFFYRLKQIDTDGQYELSDEVEIDLLPAKYELYQNYPNPFNPNTNIKFALPEDAKVSIRIYSMLGELVTELINQVYEAGYHKVEFNANRYASGVYIYSLETKNFTDIKKMVLLK